MPMVKYKIKTLSNFSSKGLMALSQSSCSIDDDCKDPDGILIRSTKLEKTYLNNTLKAISRAGAGFNNIPIDACSEKGIVVFNTPGANANAVKELVLAGLMLSSRNVFSSIDFVNNLEHLKHMKDLEPFLEENKKRFKGREIAYHQRGFDVLKKLESAIEEVAKIEQVPTLEGKQMIMVLAPR